MRTLGERLGPAMAIVDQDKADAYFEELVLEQLTACAEKDIEMTRARAEEIERSNLAYYAGYYGNDVRERVERLFRCKHPVFGAIAEKGAPTMEQAFRMGADWMANRTPEEPRD